MKKVVASLLWYRENLLNASKKKPKHDVPKYSTFREFERAEKEILRHVQGRAFSEELNYPMKLVKKSSHLYNLDPHVIDGLLCVGGRLCNVSLLSERKNQIILPKEWHVTKLIIYNHYSICGHWQRARPSLISREVLYPTRKFYCQRHSLKVCELLSLIGAPLSTENG